MPLRILGKSSVEKIPHQIARLLVHVPFSVRLGRQYNATRALIQRFSSMEPDEKEKWIFEKLKYILLYSYENIAFYKYHYDNKRYNLDKFQSLEYFQDVPLVTKSDLREFDLTDRSATLPGAMKLNTGGTSGEVLEFYVDSQAFAREWGHMHWIWERHGYDRSQTKLTLRGKNLGHRAIKYNAVHNEFILNAYAKKSDIVHALKRYLNKERIFWVHGYPSLIADFGTYIAENEEQIAERLQRDLRGVFLGSEFPAPHYRSEIERTLSPNVIPWYGHSEMCALAFEQKTNIYVPLHTYGYCEAVNRSSGNHLIATSYWNTASPFVRYDTGDLIDCNREQNLVSCFSIKDGRVGDFIIDRNSNRIGLTALIFGRHHLAFEKIAHVQVRQLKPGHIELLLVPRISTVKKSDIASSFDFTYVAVDVKYSFVDEPIRTAAGKIKLLV